MNLSEINLSDIKLQEAGDWPLAGRLALAAIIMAVVIGGGYYFFTSDQLMQLETVANEEQSLRQEFIEKQRVAANLEAFRAQLAQMETDLSVMLRQLPTGTEMPDLLEGNVPLAAAMTTIPMAIMAVYLIIARRLGAFEAL